jgi:glycosyltransferase involved in cell wall biosynthesis
MIAFMLAKDLRPTLRILGIRGLPATHGGFETFAEYLTPYLVSKGWRVVVYCQETGSGPWQEDIWNGVERIRIPVGATGSKASVIFDWHATRHASRYKDLCLTLGYNTAIFCALLRVSGTKNLINMDGIEWSRAKWKGLAKAWFWLNDWAGCWLGNHLIADHPEIKVHLSSRVRQNKITMIPYGAERVQAASESQLQSLGLKPGRFLTVIARPEPENSLLEIVEGFSTKPRDYQLVILGKYDDADPYHRKVKAAANANVRFLGAIYDKSIVQALRFYSAAYVHGHQVGGTNPSLVEALGASNAVIAHDNRFNRWVAGDKAHYFSSSTALSQLLDEVLAGPALADMQKGSSARFEAEFTWPHVLGQYENLLSNWLPEVALKNRSASAERI